MELAWRSWEELTVVCEKSSIQGCSADGRQDVLKSDLFVLIRRRQILLALIWLNEIYVYSCVISLHMVLTQ